MTKSSSRKDPKPYIDLKQSGADAKRVYIKAREDGYKNYECLFLICGIFDLELHEAREIAHSVNLPETNK